MLALRHWTIKEKVACSCDVVGEAEVRVVKSLGSRPA